MRPFDFTFFQNRDCVYFPCHPLADEESFNCLFCYCPLYALGKRCGGSFTYTEQGIKSCVNCLRPHSEEGYGYILSRFPEVAQLAKEQDLEGRA